MSLPLAPGISYIRYKIFDTPAARSDNWEPARRRGPIRYGWLDVDLTFSAKPFGLTQEKSL
jgi:hypothetical protein